MGCSNFKNILAVSLCYVLKESPGKLKIGLGFAQHNSLINLQQKLNLWFGISTYRIN
jgi:hypothetical protein